MTAIFWKAKWAQVMAHMQLFTRFTLLKTGFHFEMLKIVSLLPSKNTNLPLRNCKQQPIFPQAGQPFKHRSFLHTLLF